MQQGHSHTLSVEGRHSLKDVDPGCERRIGFSLDTIDCSSLLVRTLASSVGSAYIVVIQN